MLPTLNFAHATYGAQLRFKRGIVQEALTRIAKIDGEVGETVPSPREWAYRNTAQYLVTGGRLAYREREGHAPVFVDEDPLVIEPLAEFIARLDVSRLWPARELVLRGSSRSGEVLAALVGEGAPKAFGRAVDALLGAGAVGVSLAPPAGRRFGRGAALLAGEPTVLERYGAYDLSVAATGFAQVNPLAAGELYRAAAGLAGTGGRALDLYGGAGGLGLHLAPQYREVTVLDVAEEALRRGEADAARLGFSHLRFVRGSAARAPNADTIVVDPPRAGLDLEARAALHHNTASRLVYVSCEESTWARDVGELVRGGWDLRHVTPHDFYPQTSHVEVLSLLTR